MKILLSLLMTTLVVTMNGQTMSNKEIITEINHELGGDSWLIQGDNILVDNGSFSVGRGIWGLSKVTYELKYEFFSVTGEGRNTYVLYVKCKEDNYCIEDQANTDSRGSRELRLPIHDDEKRSYRVLNLIKSIR
jgi:hypothetical protein